MVLIDKVVKRAELLQRLNSEIDRRTAIEEEHERLVCAGDIEGSIKLLRTLDDAIIKEIRKELDGLEGEE